MFEAIGSALMKLAITAASANFVTQTVYQDEVSQQHSSWEMAL